MTFVKRFNDCKDRTRWRFILDYSAGGGEGGGGGGGAVQQIHFFSASGPLRASYTRGALSTKWFAVKQDSANESVWLLATVVLPVVVVVLQSECSRGAVELTAERFSHPFLALQLHQLRSVHA